MAENNESDQFWDLVSSEFDDGEDQTSDLITSEPEEDNGEQDQFYDFTDINEKYESHRQFFEQTYVCFPLSHINKPHLEDGNRIIMPPSALDRLLSIEIEYPMVFEIENPDLGRVSRCGILEFSGDEGLVLLPEWMMKNMELVEGQLVNVKNTSLPKGTYMKIQPHTMNFINNVSDHKAVLEAKLRDFSCVTTGDTIMIVHNCEKYYIDIVETKPLDAISLVETDCEVEFATPLDYKEPQKKRGAAESVDYKEPQKKRGAAESVDYKEPQKKRGAAESDKAQEKGAKEKPKFKPFSGIARRLDSMVNMESSTESCLEKGVQRVVLGTDDDDDAMQPPRNQKKRFQSFTGKSYRLTD